MIGDGSSEIIETLDLLEPQKSSNKNYQGVSRPMTLVLEDGVVDFVFSGTTSQRHSTAELLKAVNTASKPVEKMLTGAWSQFRGNADGKAVGSDTFAADWSASKNIIWKSKIPGLGWSSPVLDSNEVWLTTSLDNQKSLRAICLDIQTGTTKFDIEVFVPKKLLEKHPRNSHATPTPVLDKNNVYVHYGSYGTAAIARKTGKVLWRNENTKIDHQWGPGSSPILYKDLVIFNCDGRDKRYVIALDKVNGRQVWKLKRSVKIDKDPFFKKSFSTPAIVKVEGRDLLLSAGANQFSAIDPASGKELWSHEYFGYAGVAAPITSGDIAIVASGYGDISLNAVSLNASSGSQPGEVIWSRKQNAPIIPTPIVVDQCVYSISDKGILCCIDLKSGKLNWRKRLRGEFGASVVYGDNKLYFANNLGETYVVKPSNKRYEEISVNKLNGNIQATPALYDSTIFIRTDKELVRIGEK